jgi:hypothetical protein
MNWFDMSPQQQFDTLRSMVYNGGGFAAALATAWQMADSSNSEALARAFPDMVRKYGRGGALHIKQEAEA